MMNYLKRRFSSGDLQNEHDEGLMTMPTSTDSQHSHAPAGRQSQPPPPPPPHWESKSSTYTSAPSSPTRNVSLANQFINVARGVVNQAMQQIPHQPGGPGGPSTTHPQQQQQHHHPSPFHAGAARDLQHVSKDKCKLLLVIDDQHTDW